MIYLSKIDLMFHIARKALHLNIERESAYAKIDSHNEYVSYIRSLDELEDQHV